MTVDSRYSSLKTIVPGVSRETNERLIAFEELFRKWSSAI
ncbi:16S rRNA (guanine(527)-N(7))-methyltransferase RsmG, partial [Salmonella enterica subsp. enterica serovar Alachua]|nr:16S rRNA (guanine(527)-N(7))-methyltransferase RsmG [Salmonella enterica subsp. enterica serovar Alachua]